MRSWISLNPSVARDATGDFVITWQSSGQDGDGYGVYAQRYTLAGIPQGSEFRVNAYTTDDQALPSVATDAAGNLVISWMSVGQDGDGSGVYAQRYASDGTPQGLQFQANTLWPGDQLRPSVAMDAAGNFVVAWGSGDDVFARRFVSFSHRIVLGEGEIVQGIDFGNYYVPGEIHGSKWHDLNGDGVWDGDEPAVSGGADS